MHLSHINISNFLTLVRLVCAPIIIPSLIVYLSAQNYLCTNICIGLLFVVFGSTDFFDGYFARKYKQETLLGRLLDPIADKFFMFSTFVALVAVHKIFFYWGIIFIGREFFVMGLREVALTYNFAVPVMYVGKIKTFAQMAYVTCVIVNPYQGSFWSAPIVNGIEAVLLLIALFYTVYSAVTYYCLFMKQYYSSVR